MVTDEEHEEQLAVASLTIESLQERVEQLKAKIGRMESMFLTMDLDAVGTDEQSGNPRRDEVGFVYYQSGYMDGHPAIMVQVQRRLLPDPYPRTLTVRLLPTP